MKKKDIFGILTILISSIAFGQSDCSEFESKIESLNLELTQLQELSTTQEETIDELKGDIEYFKETLNLLESKIVIEQDGFVLKINSVAGRRSNGTVTITGLVENTGVLPAFRPREFKTMLYDAKGNIYKASKMSFGNLDNLQEFQKNLPVTFSVVFDKIGEEMPVIKNLTLVFNNRTGYEYGHMIFENLDVIWD